MNKAIGLVALLTLGASSGCTPRMAVAATVGVLAGVAIAAAADEHAARHEERPVCAYRRSGSVVVYYPQADPGSCADPWDSWD